MKYNRKKTSNLSATDDEKQELDIVIYKVFKKYDPEKRVLNKKTGEMVALKFSTLLVWWVKSYCTSVVSKNLSKKNDMRNITVNHLDYKTDEDGKTLQDLIADDGINIERTIQTKEYFKYIESYITSEKDRQLLDILMGYKKGSEYARELGVTRQRVNKLKREFARKLAILTDIYEGREPKFELVKKEVVKEDIIEGQLSMF